jgi:iron complex outermembrane receptor protein
MNELRRVGTATFLGLAIVASIATGSERLHAETATAPSGVSDALSEIVITATRRAQNLQDVPVAVSAVTAESAAQLGITGTESLQTAVPALVMTRQANGATPYLRGVGFATGDTNGENSVAIYVDGVYQPIPMGNFFEFNNLDRVEVLKGPQGTVFGRNATGGVIQVITKDPSFTPTAKLTAGVANYETGSGSLYASAGVTDKVAMDLSATYEKQNAGWGHDLTTGAPTFRSNSGSARSKILIRPDDDTRIVIAADYYHYNNQGLGAQPPFGVSGNPANCSLCAPTPSVPAHVFPGSTGIPFFPPLGGPVPPGDGYPGRYNLLSDTPNNAHANSGGLSFTLEHDFGGLQIRNIAAYRKFNGVWWLDQDLSRYPIINAELTQQANTITEELHFLAPQNAKFQWVAGAYYFRHRAGFEPLDLKSAFAFAPLSEISISADTVAQSSAVFAQGVFPLAESYNLTIGIRETWDKSHFSGEQNGVVPGVGQIPLVPFNTGDLRYQKPTWRIGLDHKFAPDVLGYVTYNRGVKSGNFSVSGAVSTSQIYQPEQLDAYEIGLKTELFEHRFRFNSGAFYYSYKNAQFQKIVQGGSSTLVADTEKLYGLEAELEARASEALTLNFSGAYLHSRVGNFPFVATVRLPNGQSQNTVPGLYNSYGNDAPNAPNFSGNIGANYRVSLSYGALNLSTNLFYTTKYFSEPDNRLVIQGHELLSAAIGWTDPAEKITVRVWGKNLTDVYYYEQLTGQDGGSDIGSPAPPRTFGVTASYKFN